jgi:hypothetical protein
VGIEGRMKVIREWRSTPAERVAPYSCDRYLDEPDDILFRAVDIDAPEAVVFRWLCQLRVAPYSYDWIDNYGRRSPRELTPGLETLHVGQRFMGIFTLVDHQPDSHITLVLDDPRARRLFGEIAVTYQVRPGRLVVKMLVRRPRGLSRVLAPLLPAGDLMMMRKQLLTLKACAEGPSSPEGVLELGAQ